MTFLESLRGLLFGRKVNVDMQIDPESIKENNTVKALAYENAELKGKNAKLESKIAKQREQEKDLEDEENVKAS